MTQDLIDQLRVGQHYSNEYGEDMIRAANLIESQARRIEALEEALEQAAADFEDIAQLALKRIDDGEEHGARVWRIALQDIAKEADVDRQDVRAALHVRDGE